MDIKTPVEILEYTSDVGIAKTQRRIPSVLLLAFLAGAYIAFASSGTNMAAYNLLNEPGTYGLGRVMIGLLFGSGLMLIILAGGELFTGNSLIIVSVLDRRNTVSKMLLNWLLVWAGNFVGAFFIAWMCYVSGMFNASGGLLGGVTIKIAFSKVSLAFFPAFILGVMCNWLVSLAVWGAYATKDYVGKVMIIFFAIFLFATSGYEHVVANMYYIPAGIFASQNPQWVYMSNIPADQLAGLNWLTCFTKNFFPVTFGNIVGGAVFVGFLYWLAVGKRKTDK